MSQFFRYQAIDASGVVSGARVHFRKGRAPGVVYTDRAMRAPARNPMKADSLGRVVAYIPEGEELEVTVNRADGTFLEQFDSTTFINGTDHIIEQPAPEPEIIEKVVETDRPETLARINFLERAIAEAHQARDEAEARAKAVESELAETRYSEPESETSKEGFDLDKLDDDLRREAEAHGDPQKYLWEQYQYATGVLFMPDADPKPEGYWASRQMRLSRALYKPNRDAAVEVL